MNITVFSGGSGNTQILKALYDVNPFAKVNVIVNAYDNGKSTGICRTVTNTLGVSDIRKNQYKIRKLLKGTTEKDKIDSFLEDRFDLKDWPDTRLDVLARVRELTNTHIFDKYINNFFDLIDYHVDYKRIQFRSFNLANIVYAEMFRELGYKETIDFFNKFLEIDTSKFNVIVNSYKNVFISANTENETVLEDEADIVEFSNPENKITDIVFSGDVKNDSTKESILAIKESDVIIISTGTFWSSLQPTFAYSTELTEAVNQSNAKKLWFINSNEDKDTYNVSVSELINHLEKTNLNVKDFKIVENLSAVDNLKETVVDYTIKKFDFGNNKGKHEVEKLIEYFKDEFFGFIPNVKNIYIDFDDTLYGRNFDSYSKMISFENVYLSELINSKIPMTVISGNTFESIKTRLKDHFFNNESVIADSNSCYYEKGELLKTVDEFKIENKEEIVKLIIENFPTFSDNIEENDFYIKIKPIYDDDSRDYIVNKLNVLFFNTDVKAFKRGRTTIDILNINNNKANAIEALSLPLDNSLYVGDEIDVNGNDKEISEITSKYIRVNSIFETNYLFKTYFLK